ncbi:MAG TPA: YggS family pyridoxal phosphate-dependent enzyme [Clostridia bacterium]|nr:YggS family pyridoxal phosphate-dependent enzyme [Clostridia bacterium]
MNIEKLKQNLDLVKKAIADTGAKDVQIVAATKTQTIETIDMLHSLDASIIFGENRVQEMCLKFNPKYSWHFIGQLQSNKVKDVIDKVELIHSLDRLSLAQELEKQAEKHGKFIFTLIEINIGNELSKGGIEEGELNEFAKQLTDFSNIKVEGIMSVAPSNLTGDKLNDCFKKLQEMFLSLKGFNAPNFDVKTLSAGMSHDFVSAVKYGANMVRLGTALFGERI